MKLDLQEEEKKTLKVRTYSAKTREWRLLYDRIGEGRVYDIGDRGRKGLSLMIRNDSRMQRRVLFSLIENGDCLANTWKPLVAKNTRERRRTRLETTRDEGKGVSTLAIPCLHVESERRKQ